MFEITREIAIKVRDTVDAGLVKGKGIQIPGQMCVDAAVCYAMGLPHSDEPPCVSAAVRSLKIGLNDSAWSSDEIRGRGMRRLALAQLGSAGTVDDAEFNRRVIEVIIRRFVPIALRAAASVHDKQFHKDALEAAAVSCEKAETSGAASEAARAASWAASEAASGAASAASAARAARAASWAASEAASGAASEAGWAASWAASEAASGAASAAASGAASEAASDKILAEFAECVVLVLIEMKAPGCQWLDLVPINPSASNPATRSP